MPVNKFLLFNDNYAAKIPIRRCFRRDRRMLWRVRIDYQQICSSILAPGT